jgi:hypothetical protein
VFLQIGQALKWTIRHAAALIQVKGHDGPTIGTRWFVGGRRGGARRANRGRIFAMLVTGCGTQPVARTDGHIKSEATPLTGQTPGAAVESSSIPEPVRQVSLPPPPLPRVDEVKYSVTVKDVPVQDLLFAISRDTKANIDVYPGIEAGYSPSTRRSNRY